MGRFIAGTGPCNGEKCSKRTATRKNCDTCSSCSSFWCLSFSWENCVQHAGRRYSGGNCVVHYQTYCRRRNTRDCTQYTFHQYNIFSRVRKSDAIEVTHPPTKGTYITGRSCLTWESLTGLETRAEVTPLTLFLHDQWYKSRNR